MPRTDRRAALLTLLACALLPALPACKRGPEPSPFVEDELVVLSDLDHAPFTFVGENGLPAGMEVELVTQLALRLERRLVWRRYPFAELLPRLRDGEGHVVAATIGVTPERARELAFSRPYFVTDLVAVVRAGEGEPRTLGDLDGRAVGAARGTSAAYAVRHVLPRAQPMVMDSERELLARLQDGRLEAVVLDLPDAQRMVAEGLPVRILAPRLDRERYAFAMSKSRPRLREEIDTALADLGREGWIERLIDRWDLRAAAR